MQRTTALFRAAAVAPRSRISSPTASHVTTSLRVWPCSSTHTSVFSSTAHLLNSPTPRLSRRNNKTVLLKQNQTRPFSSTSSNMSFSNTDTGNQPADPYKEKNKDEPGLSEKIEDLGSFVKSCKFGMMTTKSSDQDLLVSRCMALAAQETGGIDLIFHTNTESGKTDDLEADSSINMSFLDSAGSWASISGKASIITDRDVVKKYYSPALKTWVGDLGDGKHDGSANDPRIGVIRVKAKTITYATAKSNAVSRGIEMVAGAITGNAASVNKLREISESEINQWRSSH